MISTTCCPIICYNVRTIIHLISLPSNITCMVGTFFQNMENNDGTWLKLNVIQTLRYSGSKLHVDDTIDFIEYNLSRYTQVTHNVLYCYCSTTPSSPVMYCIDYAPTYYQQGILCTYHCTNFLQRYTTIYRCY